MAEKSPFKDGFNPSTSTQKPERDGSKDEYDGKYKNAADGMSEAEKWGTNLNPVEETPNPAKGLKGGAA